MADQPIYQVFIKLLNGKSQALNFPSLSSISPLSVKQRLSVLTGIPPSSLLLLLPPPSLSTPFPLFGTLLLRLRGGKGGFGSLLRGAATKSGQKKTNNFDACRDMSGRRLRHVNAERRMEEWAAGAGERGLERAAEEFLREKGKTERKRRREGGGPEGASYVDKYREDSARCVEVVERAVREAVGKNRKRNNIGAAAQGSKKLKIWMGKRKVEDSDSEDTDGDDSDDNEEQKKDNSVVLDNENHLDSNKEAEGSSDSVTGGKTNQKTSAIGSSENSSDGDEESVVRETSVNGESFGEVLVEKTAEQKRGVLLPEDTLIPETEAVEIENVKIGQVPEGEALECETTDAGTLDHHLPNPVVVAQEEIVSESTIVAVPVEPLNFEEFNSSAELEALGMEKLKSELQSWGLKCGGTLQERAARLFLLKTTPLEKLPKKLLAKK